MLMRLNSSVMGEKRTRGGERLPATERRAPPPTINKGVSVNLANLDELDNKEWGHDLIISPEEADDPIVYFHEK